MTIMAENKVGWEKLLAEYIMPGIKGMIERVANEEIALAQERVRERLRETVAAIAVRLAKQFDVQCSGQRITITFIEEDLKNK